MVRMRQLVALVLWLCVSQITAQTAQSCVANVGTCYPKFRSRYLDKNLFWFGTPYSTLCPGTPFCANVNPDLQSVMSRVLWTNDTSAQQRAVANMRILNVTFEQPGGNYYACDTSFQVSPTTPVPVNPIGPALLSQFTTQTKPYVTWTPRTPQSLYTVVMVDISYMFLHAVYINCAGGSMENGEAVMPWLGTAVTYTVNSPYTFLVYEQKSRIPLQTALQAVEDTRAEGTGIAILNLFLVNVFVEKLSTHLDPDIKFSVIMEMYSDPYGAYRGRHFNSASDLCPLFYSQLPPFHSAVKGMQIPDPKWSPPGFSPSLVSTDAHLTSLSVNIEVTYHTDDYTDTACCGTFTVTRGSYAVSPLDSRPVRAAMTRHAPEVLLTPVFLFAAAGGGRPSIAGQTYTLLLADVTPALLTGATGPKLTTHWLVTNIFASEFATGTEVAKYFPPVPIFEGQPRTYMFLLFNQPSIVDPETLRPYCPLGFERCKLRVTDLIQAWGLGDIVGVSWFRAKRDGFAIKQLYTTIGLSKQGVCHGRHGHAYSCPSVASKNKC